MEEITKNQSEQLIKENKNKIKNVKQTDLVIEKNEESLKTIRIDELEDGNQTSSTILQNKNGIIFNP